MENEFPKVLVCGKKERILETGLVEYLHIRQAGALLRNRPNRVPCLAQSSENRLVNALVPD